MTAPQPFMAMLAFLRGLVSGWRMMNAATRENLTVFGALTLLTIVTLIWAACFRKQRRHRRVHRAPHERGKNPAGAGEDGLVIAALTRRKHRRRREHRPRNPTLAETGGMPPTRVQEPSPPEA